MNPLMGIGMANGLLKGASELVQELKRPKAHETAFADLLKQQMNQSKPTQNDMRIQQLSEQFMKLHDVNGDGVVSANESGLPSEVFKLFDRNRDGQLGLEELKQTGIESIATR